MRGVVAAVIALAAHVLVVLVAILAGVWAADVTGGSPVGIAVIVEAFVSGECLTGVVCLFACAHQYRRGRRYTGLGVAGGWVVGLLALVVVRATLT